MKLSFLIRRLIRLGGYLNFFVFLYALILIIIVLYYQFGILIPTNYKILAPDAESKVAFDYGFVYISVNGLQAFFGAPLGNGTYWQLFIAFYVLTILFAVLNCIFAMILIIMGYKNKNSQVLLLGFTNMFIPIVGFISSEKFYFKNKQKVIKKISKKTDKKSFLKQMEESINQKINS